MNRKRMQSNPMLNTLPTVIKVENLYNRFGDLSIHENLNFDVKKGEIIALVGGSGAGKTTLLKTIVMLKPPTSGQVHLFDQPIWNQENLAEQEKIQKKLKQRFGMLFQSGALFSSLTVLENVMLLFKEYTKLSAELIKPLAELKISMAGLPKHACDKYPRELSGGMLKRASLARALALDPELLFLDEPTAGLDPSSASAFDELILQLARSLKLTVVMITHDLDSLWAITDKIAFLGEKKLLAFEPMKQIIHSEHPLIKEYFNGPRGRVVGEIYGK